MFSFFNKEKEKKYSWMNPKIEVRETDRYGKGIFAKENITKDETIIVMGGYILSIDDDNDLKGVVADKPMEISDLFFIGPRNPKDLDLMPQHYINHSCDPNVGFKNTIFIVAMRDIKQEEEITYDYAMIMNSHPDSNSYFTFECDCLKTNCRKIIEEDDWMKPEIQEKYNGYFSSYLQNRINNSDYSVVGSKDKKHPNKK